MNTKFIAESQLNVSGAISGARIEFNLSNTTSPFWQDCDCRIAT